MATHDSKDPIREEPPRLPGESLREQLDDFYMDTVGQWVFFSASFSVLIFAEWGFWFLDTPRQPIPFTVCGVIVIAFCSFQTRRARNEYRRRKLGLRGEIAVGQFLTVTLLPRGFRVLHDLPFPNVPANVDHVVVGPSGVFAIETKAVTKPRGDVHIAYDGNRALVNGFEPDRDPIAQARAAAQGVAKVIHDFTGLTVDVRPVVLYPGWFIEKQPPGVKVWVLNENALIGFLDRESEKLTGEQITVISKGLERYDREQDSPRRTAARSPPAHSEPRGQPGSGQ